METVFVVSCEKKDFEGSAFALWRNLWLHPLKKHMFPVGDGQIIKVHLPVSREGIFLLGERTKSLLFRRLREIIPEGASVLSKEADLLAPFIPCPQRDMLNRLGAEFLPEILGILYRQWGKKVTDGEVCILKKEESPLPLVRSLAPFVRSLSIVTPLPDYSLGEELLEEWGLAVSFRESIPGGCSLLFSWDAPLPETIPKGVTGISFWEEKEGALSPQHLLFRVPQEYLPALGSLGAVTLSHLATLEEKIPFVSRDFHLSRITKFWC